MIGIASIIVPTWYRQAKSEGDTEAVLREKIRHIIAENNPNTPTDEAVVTITLEMYEYALGKEEKV